MIDPEISQLITTVAPAIAAGSAAIAAILSLLSIRANINTARSNVLLRCLEDYLEIQKHRTDALMKKNETLCFDYYRELFDLCWTEFRLWKSGFIDDETMSIWLKIRYRNYDKNDAISFKDATGNDIKVYYKESWKKLIKENYFEKDDLFIKFMEYAHNDEIHKAIGMK